MFHPLLIQIIFQKYTIKYVTLDIRLINTDTRQTTSYLRTLDFIDQIVSGLEYVARFDIGTTCVVPGGITTYEVSVIFFSVKIRFTINLKYHAEACNELADCCIFPSFCMADETEANKTTNNIDVFLVI